jgi:alanine racemase
VLEVSPAALRTNLAGFRRLAPTAEVTCAVKADAYGLGLQAVVPALLADRVRTFFVAHLAEGVAVRALAQDAGHRPRVCVLHSLWPKDWPRAVAHDLTPVLNSAEDVAAWQAAAPASAEAWLHVDTGMSRLGLPLASVADVLARLGPRLGHLMSHLACADEPDHPQNQRQLATFRAILAQAKTVSPSVAASLSATGGVLLGPDWHFDLVRVGIGLSGAGPVTGLPGFAQAARLTAPILQVRDVPAHTAVGYGATAVVARPSRLATIALGYADGFLRSASNRGKAVVAGQVCPVVGRVSMDLTVLDVTDLPHPPVPGDTVEVFGPTLPVEEQAEALGTIGYELLTGLRGPRLTRRIVP